MQNVFAGYPAPFIHDTPGGRKIQQLIWGDWVQRFDDEEGDWARVRARRESGWMRKPDLQRDQLLEVNFIDVGRGDGAFIVMPDGRFVLIDAGEADNMVRFLSWRFNLRQHPDRVITFPHAVITHPDQDHYRGFSDLFDSMQFRFGTVYHNGIVERAGDASLGPQEQRDGQWYLTEIIGDTETLRHLLDNLANVGRRPYPRMLRGDLTDGRVGRIRAIDVSDRFLPGFGADRSVQLRNASMASRPCDDLAVKATTAKRKMDIRSCCGWSIETSASFSAATSTFPPRSTCCSTTPGAIRERPIRPSGKRSSRSENGLRSCVAKACHHGSSDFSDLFLRVVNPLATVISSGDDEP